MVKSKKMSKTSIAVIVLALLLVLSLVMGLTGAWFTDRDSDTSEDNINFGKVNITITETDDEKLAITRSNENGEIDSDKLLPGDGWGIMAEVTNFADVDMYVFVSAEVRMDIKVGEGEWQRGISSLYNEGGTTNLLSVEQLVLDDMESGTWTLAAADVTYYKLKAGRSASSVDPADYDVVQGNIYRVTPSTGEGQSIKYSTPVYFEGGVTLAEEAENVVYTQRYTDPLEGDNAQTNQTRIVINNVDTDTTVQVKVYASIFVEAIQAKNLDAAQNTEASRAAEAMEQLGYKVHSDLTWTEGPGGNEEG